MTQKKLEIQPYKKNPFLPLLQKDLGLNSEQYWLDLENLFSLLIRSIPLYRPDSTNLLLLLMASMPVYSCVSAIERRAPYELVAPVTNHFASSNHLDIPEEPSGFVLK